MLSLTFSQIATKRRIGRLKASLSTAALLILSASLPANCRPPFQPDNEYLQALWTTENGLPQNSVNAILQTKDGYLWLGTFGGLARFDGERFTIFDTANTPGMKTNRIVSLCEGRDRTLWMGAESGEIVSYKNHVAKTYTTRDGLPGGVVWGLREDRAGALWAATSNGLGRLENGKFRVYTTRDGLPDNRFWSIDEDDAGRLWFASSGGLVRFDGRAFTTFQPGGGMPADGFFVPFARERRAGYWIGANNGLTLFDGGGFILCPEVPRPPALKVWTILEDQEGTLWVGGYSPQITLRCAGGTCSQFRMKSEGAPIRAMYQDREGNLWMGSDGGGLVKLTKRRLKTYTAEDGLPGDTVRTVIGDGAGGFWIATSSGLAHWREGKFTSYSDRDGLASYDESALWRDRSGGIWIGSNLGLSQFINGRFINYGPKQGLSNPEVHAIVEDRDGSIWIGTASGLNRLRDGRFTVWHQADGLVNDNIRAIAQASDGGLWLGTVAGLIRLKDGVFTNYTTRNGLSNDYVRDILIDPDGTLWLGTYGGGLNRLRDGRFTAITTGQGLFDDFISRVLDDGHGNLWLLGNRGISRISREQLNDFVERRSRSITSISYGIADGMKSSEGNGGDQPAGWRGMDGKLWFPTIKGLVVLDPSQTNKLAPAAVIEQAVLDGRILPTGQPVQIKPGQQNLEIRYTALSFTRPERVHFKFQLQGLDRDWMDAGRRRTAYYPHLPPGKYTFKLIAGNGDGVWDREGAELDIFVARPYWMTWWFLTFALVGVAGIVFFAVRYRVLQLQRAQAAQQTFSRQLIASQENERKRIAAELHDSLGQRLVIIKNLALLLLQTRDGASGLNGSQRERVEEISEEVSGAVREVKEISYNLRPYRLDRLGLTAALEAMIETASAASKTVFSAEIDNIDGMLPQPHEINFYRIVQECVNNILKHSQAGHATVRIRRAGERLTLTVQDDGNGFAADSIRVDSPLGGFGLTGISERAQLLGGKAAIQSTPGQGTTVTIEIDSET